MIIVDFKIIDDKNAYKLIHVPEYNFIGRIKIKYTDVPGIQPKPKNFR